MEKAKRYFSQRELEKHINARLIRERKKKTELEALKNMVDTLIGEGKINADSYAEAAEKLMAMIAGAADENLVEEKTEIEKDDAAKLGTVSDEDIADTEKIAPGNEDIRKRRVQTANDAHSFFETETDAAADKTADAGDAVPENVETGVYSSARLVELFRELLGILEGRTKDSTKDSTKDDNGFFARRDICSTGFSKTGSGEDMSLAQTLTPTQREIARRAGLSYREYAGLLREIPENARKRRQMR